MRKITYFLFLITSLIYGQESQLPFSFSIAEEITLLNNYIYISDIGVDNLYRFDKNSTNPALETLLDINDLTCVNSLETFGNEIVYSEECSSDKIFKVDVGTSNITQLLSNVNNIRSMTLNGNDLYFYSVVDNKIFRSDISNSTPNSIELGITADSVSSLLIVNNILFFTGSQGVWKSDLSITPFSANLISFDNSGLSLIGPQNLSFYNNEIYLTDVSDNGVFKFDPNLTNPIISNVASTSSTNYQDMIVENNIIWLLKPTSLSKIDLSTLSNTGFEENEISIFPNPTKNFIEINGLSNWTEIKVFDINGKLLLQNKIIDKLDISELANGIYFAKIGNYKTKKIIKK